MEGGAVFLDFNRVTPLHSPNCEVPVDIDNQCMDRGAVQMDMGERKLLHPIEVFEFHTELAFGVADGAFGMDIVVFLDHIDGLFGV